jgi:hypothetical protein
MCGPEYGGGGGGERRDLHKNQLTGPLPTELGELGALLSLCVRPAPPPHLSMCFTHPREARWVGEQVNGCCGLTPEEGELFVLPLGQEEGAFCWGVVESRRRSDGWGGVHAASSSKT